MKSTLDSFDSEKRYDSDRSSKRLLIFRLYGSFAHFNQPMSNRFRNTYSIIPKPQILGVLGSIAGFDGYKNRKTMPEYYRLLEDVKVYINPNNERNQKFIVNYNSMNSFLSNRVDGASPNVIIKEQILVNPDYEIGLLVDQKNDLHKIIIENIQQNRSTFPIYFGKNEFFANIQFILLGKFELNSNKDVVCKSILPLEEIETEGTRNMKLELLPVGFDEKFKYKYRLMAIPQKECEIPLQKPNNFIEANGNVYYAF